MNIAVYKVILGDGTLANLDERRFEGIYMDSTVKQEIERIRAVNGNENKLTYDSKNSARLDYKKYRYYVFEVVPEVKK